MPTPKPPWPWSLPGTIGFRSQSGWTLGLPRRRLDSTCPPRPGHGKWVGALAVCVCVCCSDCRAAVVVPWFSTLLGVIHRIPSPAPLTGTVFLPPLPLDSAEAVASTVLWISSTSSVSQRKVFIRNHPHNISVFPSYIHTTLNNSNHTMVGVPGKYRGCETCRGRRVKCGAPSPPFP